MVNNCILLVQYDSFLQQFSFMTHTAIIMIHTQHAVVCVSTSIMLQLARVCDYESTRKQ